MTTIEKLLTIALGFVSGIAIYYIRKCDRLEDEVSDMKDLIEMSLEVANNVDESNR